MKRNLITGNRSVTRIYFTVYWRLLLIGDRLWFMKVNLAKISYFVRKSSNTILRLALFRIAALAPFPFESFFHFFPPRDEKRVMTKGWLLLGICSLPWRTLQVAFYSNKRTWILINPELSAYRSHEGDDRHSRLRHHRCQTDAWRLTINDRCEARTSYPERIPRFYFA